MSITRAQNVIEATANPHHSINAAERRCIYFVSITNARLWASRDQIAHVRYRVFLSSTAGFVCLFFCSFEALSPFSPKKNAHKHWLRHCLILTCVTATHPRIINKHILIPTPYNFTRREHENSYSRKSTWVLARMIVLFAEAVLRETWSCKGTCILFTLLEKIRLVQRIQRVSHRTRGVVFCAITEVRQRETRWDTLREIILNKRKIRKVSWFTILKKVVKRRKNIEIPMVTHTHIYTHAYVEKTLTFLRLKYTYNIHTLTYAQLEKNI